MNKMNEVTFRKKKIVNTDNTHDLFVIPQILNIKFDPVRVKVKGVFLSFDMRGYVSGMSEDNTFIFNIIIGDEITDYRFLAKRFNKEQAIPNIGEIRIFNLSTFKADFYNNPSECLWPKSNWTKLSNSISVTDLFDDNQIPMINEFKNREKRIIGIYHNEYIKKSSNSKQYNFDDDYQYGNDNNDVEWGGLYGEEAYVGYWNTQ